MSSILVFDFVVVFMIFLRISSALAVAPIFGQKAFPMLPKLLFGFILALIVFFTLDKNSVNIDLSLWSLAANGLKEVVTGLIIGFMLNLIFYGITFAGSIIGFDMGLSMAEVFNPMEENNNIIGEMIYLGALMIFLMINGHHYVIQGLAHSFTIVPIGYFTITKPAFDLLIKYSAAVFIIGVKISAPILVSFFLINIAEGIIARVIPQMQVFFVTQPLKLGLGFLILVMVVPIYVYVVKNLLKAYENNLLSLIKAMGS